MTKRIIFYIVLLGFIATSVFLSLQIKPIEELKYTGEVERIRIGNIGEYSIFNLIAQKNGYFLENGLDADIQEYDSGASSITALLNGEVDVAIAADTVGVRNMFTRPDLKIISEASRHKVFEIVARTDRRIKTPADLAQKRIGVTKKTAGEFFLDRFLTFNAISSDRVVLRDLPPAEIVAQLEKGSIDAAVIFEPHVYELKQTLGDGIIVWPAQGDQDIFALIYSTDGFIKAKPEIIQRYLKALADAEKYTEKNSEAVKLLISETLGYEKEYVDYSWRKFNHFLGLNQELLLRMEDQARWAITNQLTDSLKVPNYLNFIYFDTLQEIKPQSITIIRS